MHSPVEPPDIREQTDIPYSAELARKALHLVALVVPVGMALLGRTWSIYLLVPLALVAFGADVLRARSSAFNIFIDRFFGFMMRGTERPAQKGVVSINGATWILITAAVLAILFPIRIAASAFAMFMLSDAAAALIGRRFGKRYWTGTTRTVEGSLAFLVTGILFMWAVPHVSFWAGVAGVLAAAVAEIPERPLNDNFRAPLAAAIVVFFLEKWLL